MKILLFGGAFDPPHNGHLSILKEAAQYTEFDKIIVMPTGTPTHKKGCMVPFDVRHYMAQLAFGKVDSDVEISDYEGTNLKDDYTYLTLRHLKEKYDNADIFMLIGSDSLFSIDSWKNSPEILANCTPVVFARKTGVEQEIYDKIAQLRAQGANAVYIPYKVTDVSSSGFRGGQHSDSVLPGAVDAVIDEYHLYDDNETKRLQGTAKLLAKIMLDEKRYIHTLNVEKLAAELGIIYHLDVDKLRIAALLHDILKHASYDILLHRAGASGIINRIKDKPKQTLHGFAAADYAEKELGITDEDILWSVRSHTCGRSGMTDMEKVIYLADMLCEGRKFESRDYLLSLARKNLDLAMYKALVHSVEWIKSKGNEIDTDSLEALEYFRTLTKADCKEEKI